MNRIDDPLRDREAGSRDTTHDTTRIDDRLRQKLQNHIRCLR